jgi:tetratricopeptide (TPR) repeat protein
MLLPLALSLSLAQTPDADALRRMVAVESANVERAPDDTDALYRLGLAYLSLNEPRRAITPLEALVKKDPESIDAKLLLARAYRTSNEVEKARALLDTAITSMPDVSALFSERAQLARQLDDTATAIKHYRRAIELVPSDAQLQFNLGEALQKASRLDEAIATYKKTLELDPELTAARVNLGKALAEKGLYQEAKEVLGAVTKQSLVDAEAHYNLGVILMREGSVSLAVAEFERAVAISPKHAQALNNLGVAWDQRANDKKALEYFKKAAAADPTYAEAFFNQGMTLMNLNQTVPATRAFEQALKLEPGSSGPYVQLGTLYLKQGKRDYAVEAFKKAVAAIDEEDKKTRGFLQLRKYNDLKKTTDAYRGLALAYLALGKVDDAVAALKTAVDKLPKDASARKALGEAYLAQNKYDEAVEQLKERLSLENTADAKLDLARAYVKKRVAKQAEPLFREVIKAEPGNRDAIMGLVDLYLSMGSYADADKLLDTAIAKDPNDLQALSRKGILKSRMGRPNEALEPLERVSQQNPLLFDARAEYAFLLFRGDPGNTDRCLSTMSDILTSDPRNVLALHYRGVCLFAKGNKPRAEESFKAALAVDPQFAAAAFSLGELYENEGKPEDAKKAYEVAANFNHSEARDALRRLAGGAKEPGPAK